jgi:hypothetical protein
MSCQKFPRPTFANAAIRVKIDQMCKVEGLLMEA